MAYRILKEVGREFIPTGEISHLSFEEIDAYLQQLQQENGGCYAAEYVEDEEPVAEEN